MVDSGSAGGIKVLLVDDEPAAPEIFAAAFEQGYSRAAADSGGAALAQANEILESKIRTFTSVLIPSKETMPGRKSVANRIQTVAQDLDRLFSARVPQSLPVGH